MRSGWTGIVNVNALKQRSDSMDKVKLAEHVKAVKFGTWVYYVNDEGKARWRCSLCGKACRRIPIEKRFCSSCGTPMRLEQ